MSRETMSLRTDDLSAFAKSLRKQLALHVQSEAALPGHLSLLNMLARAAGYRNLQSLQTAPPVALTPPPAPARGPKHPELTETADRALRQFDAQGRLMRWPSRYQVQRYALWGLWLHFDGKRRYSEAEVNELLNSRHSFGDHCTLRRELINMRLLARTDGGREYRKLAARPDAALLPLLRELRARSLQA
jgi:hypothetical protein